MKLIVNGKVTLFFHVIDIFFGCVLIYLASFFVGFFRYLLFFVGFSVLVAGKLIADAMLQNISVFKESLTWPPDKKK